MKTVDISVLGALAEDVRKGETVEILDGEKAVARLNPIAQDLLEENISRLTQEGNARRGIADPFPEQFFSGPEAKSRLSVLEQLLEDRRTGR